MADSESPMTLTESLILQALTDGIWVSVYVGAFFTLMLLAKSIRDFTRTGPQMSAEVMSHYRYYLAFSLTRLGLFAFLIASSMAQLGILLFVLGSILFGYSYSSITATLAAALGICFFTGRQFLRMLILSPGVLTSSSNYSLTRFYGLWEHFNPARLRWLDRFLFAVVGGFTVLGLFALVSARYWSIVGYIIAVLFIYGVIIGFSCRQREPKFAPNQNNRKTPNIILIGSDTLRADRLNGSGYPRQLTPTLEALAQRATRFTDCYVPCARTAPSLVSILTGTWPHTHAVRDTFVTPEESNIPVAALPEILSKQGYTTAAVGDWAVSDVDKFHFGFDYTDMPRDQWNIKYLLRQGPKDIRLFLSLFTQNSFGKRFLPEVYYLGGHPLTEEVGRDTRRMIERLAKKDAPFFIMSFMATTHPPFTSKWPYYRMFADKTYRGESKFAMARVRDPFEIIRRQGEPKTEFDLDQIINLYDGCVKNFDDELKRILDYLEASGLTDNTIIAVFSDHGMEFFEHETWGQGNSAIGDFSARVPLLIADPRNPTPRTISQVVRTVDIAPTLLDLIDVPEPKCMEGVSLAPFIRGESLRDELLAFYETGVWLTDLPGTPNGHLRYPNLPELLEVPDKKLGMISLKPKYQDIIIAAKDRMVRSGEWKLTYQPLQDGPIYQLFNIQKDPACQYNVLEQNKEIAERIKYVLADWMSEKPDTRNKRLSVPNRKLNHHES